MRTLLICLALFFLTVPSMAQVNLEPDDTPVIAGEGPRLFGKSYGRGLKPVIGKDVRVFAVVEGGLVPDFAVGLKAVKSGYRIFNISERRGSGLDRCETPIDNDLALDIVLAWDKVLRQTCPRVGRPMGGADVPFFHFGSRLPSGLVMGRVWDTPRDSNPAHLWRIASGLLQMCSGDRVQPIPEALGEIRTALKAIH
jgi:hypothetical protein